MAKFPPMTKALEVVEARTFVQLVLPLTTASGMQAVRFGMTLGPYGASSLKSRARPYM